ncbi:hypothetical protein GIB67_043204 [Kingdonia uniflora]|uniref:PGG domain-containing protein n=1 Tax=Kingdonia uniflora TaxID=39325 RepID=A0A7J7NJS4_9MAGN|nr:hypothetical protein GIB67_043204 [Kingdonia uniflora]
MKETHVEVNAVNSNGLTALDLLLTLPTDSNEDSIAKLLKNAGGERAFNPPTQVLSPQVQSPEPSLNQNFTNSSSRSDKGESIRNGIIILSVMFATLAFEVALSPPGGLWQEWDSIANQNSTISKIVHLKKNKGHLIPAFPKVSPANYHKPGKVITWELASKEFSKFLVSNALCFYTSLFGIIGAVIPKKFDYDLRIFIFLVLFSAGSLYATGLTLVTEWKVTKWVFQSVILSLAFGFTTFFLIKLLIKNKVWRRIKRNVVCY